MGGQQWSARFVLEWEHPTPNIEHSTSNVLARHWMLGVGCFLEIFLCVFCALLWLIFLNLWPD
jgi:hypothetical protein